MNKNKFDFIFVVSPGRSGTSYLFNLLQNIKDKTNENDIVCFHEPLPIGFSIPMRFFYKKYIFISHKPIRNIYFSKNIDFSINLIMN